MADIIKARFEVTHVSYDKGGAKIRAQPVAGAEKDAESPWASTTGGVVDLGFVELGRIRNASVGGLVVGDAITITISRP